MPQSVDVKGVGIVKFPDDYTPEQITIAIERDILPRVATAKKTPTQTVAEETSDWDAAKIGAGRVFDRIGSGLTQGALKLSSWLPYGEETAGAIKAEQARLDADQTDKTKRYAEIEKAHPKSAMAGEIVAQLPFGVIGKGYKAAMAAGALPGLIEYGSGSEKLMAGALGAAGGAAGQALGDMFARLVSRRAGVPLMDSERAELVRAAREMGFDLSPGQVHGKNWQKNIEAAFAQNPATSGRVEKVRAANQATTNRVVDTALERAGGEIDQLSAGAAAKSGLDTAKEAEAGAVDRAYRAVLKDVDVNLEGARPGFERTLARQRELPEANQGAEAVKALEGLLGSPRAAAPAKARPRAMVDPAKDDIIAAIRKLGGIDPSDEAVGSLAKANKFDPSPLGPVWAKRTGGSLSRSGHSLDVMAQRLKEHGYRVDGPDDVMDKIADSYMGTGSHFSDAVDYSAQQAAEDPLASAINRLVDKMDAKTAPPEPKAGYLKDNPTISGDRAQTLRSDYGVKSEAAYANAKNQAGDAWREMRGTIDSAIEDALPAGAKKQFASVNERYGMGAGLRMLKTDDQQLILNKIYRGFDSPDAFANFVALAPDKEFREVARGFLSKIVKEATGDNGVNAAKLGRAVRAADKSDGAAPSALKMLGQESGDTLRTVGKIGEQLLPELPNSQTANRALFQNLIMGSAGAIGGGSYGGAEFGTPGAIAGTAAGAFLAPRTVQKVYLSDLAKRFMERGAKDYAGVPALRNLPPEVLELLSDLLRGSGAGLAASVSQ